MKDNKKEKINEQISYFLHLYYPDNRDNLTNQDWFLFQALTNVLCGLELVSIRHLFSKEQLSKYDLPKELINEIYG